MTGPLTSEFSDDLVVPVQLPEPQARDIPVIDEEMPGGVKRVVKAARAAGFDVVVTYARGPWQDKGKESYTIKQGIAVRGTRQDVPYNAIFRASWTSSNYPKPQSWTFNTAHVPGILGTASSVALNDYIVGPAPRQESTP